MKILIFTLIGNGNIGNRLQHYALKHTLQSLGCSVDSAQYINRRENEYLTILKLFVKKLLGMFGVKKYLDINIKSFFKDKRREKYFRDFSSKRIGNYIPFDFDDIYTEKAKKIISEYDYAITGSDQVWHRWFNKEKNELDYFYLSFFPNYKRISYAASFGFSKFDSETREVHRRGLSGIQYLSVRETEMVPMIKELTGIEARVVVDPTLLLNKEDWDNIKTKPHRVPQNKYVVTYFIGEITKEYKSAINNLVQSIELECNEEVEVVNIHSLENNIYYDISPDEFLYLIADSEFVFTDSFHGTVFSLIYNKNFLVFKRKEVGNEDMFGRISGMLDMLQIDNHYFISDTFSIPNEIDYKKTNQILCELRNQSMGWLQKIILQ